MRLSSSSFGHGEPIPARHTCEAADVAPPLEWQEVPDGTRSFVLIMDDPDASKGTFTHWVVFDIPAEVTGFEEDEAEVGVSGRNDFQYEGYGGPCPPPNHPPHRYRFRLYALEVETLGLEAGVKREQVEEAMGEHVLARAELVGRFERRPGPVK